MISFAIVFRFFFFKQKTAYEISACLVGSEMCIRDRSAYAGGRLEGMLDATYFFNGRQLNPKFSVNVLAGGELGYIQKENGYRPAKGGYTGFTGGLQFKYRLWGDVSLFAEPRTSLASYSLKTNEKEEGRYVAKKFTDNLYSINICLLYTSDAADE